MKRVLIITYYWPPQGGSGVQRWVKFSKYLPSFGWTPVIYTPENPDMTATDETLSKDIPEQAIILRRPIIEPYSLFRKMVGAPKDSAPVNHISGGGKKSWKMKLSLWLRANIFVPDPKFLWIRPSVKFLKKYLQENPVDVIISTGPPHSMHLIARKVAKQTGIKWIADFRDPWTKIFYFKHLPLMGFIRRRYSALEKKVLMDADKVVTVSEPIRKEFEQMIKSWNGKTPVFNVENGYDESDFEHKDGAAITPDSQFTLVHTGLFAQEGNPQMLWKVLGELCSQLSHFKESLSIRLIGKVDNAIKESIERESLSENTIYPGYLPHNQVNTIQQSARILLLPLRKEPEAEGILTGKYFEYLAAHRPIIAFGPGQSALAESLRETGAGVIFDWEQKESLKDYILGEYIGYLHSIEANSDIICQTESLRDRYTGVRVISSKPNEENIRRFSRKALTEKIVRLF